MGLHMRATKGVKMVKFAILMLKIIPSTAQSVNMLMVWIDTGGQ